MKDIGVKLHQTLSNSKLYNKTYMSDNCTTIFFPGCSLSTHNNLIVKNIYEYLKKHINDVGLISNCCYKPSNLIGDTKSFDRYYSDLNKSLQSNNIQRVIVACPNCYKTISKNSPEVEVIFLLDFIREKGLDSNLQNHYENLDIEFMLHDACAIKGEDSIYESSRWILKELGINYLEFKFNKDKSICCGEKIKDKHKKEQCLKKKLEGINSKYIISYCQSCTRRMLTQDKNSIHILDLIFDEEMINKANFTQSSTSLIKSWTNRYKIANKIIR